MHPVMIYNKPARHYDYNVDNYRIPIIYFRKLYINMSMHIY